MSTRFTVAKLVAWTCADPLGSQRRQPCSPLQCAGLGEVGNQYPSVEKRNTDIESGASRNANDLVVDLRVSIYGLEAAWASANENLARSGAKLEWSGY